MKKTLFIFAQVLIQATLFGQLVTIPETIINNQFYVVHSGMKMNTQLNNTSNIYVIKGMQDSVWIFGTGYGDSSTVAETSDIEIYKGSPFEPTRNAIDDANEVHSIITNSFGLIVSQVKLMFVVPHHHLDHINKEFVDAFFTTLSYPSVATKIYVHKNDSTGSVCNAQCCGLTPCNNLGDPYFGVPYRKTWTPALKSKFDAIGNINDSCNQEVLRFNSPSGIWAVAKSLPVANGGHTDGAVNLKNSFYKIKVNGADGGAQCYTPVDWTKFGIHGNIPSFSTGVISIDRSIKNLQIFPNPANDRTDLKFLLDNVSDVEIRLYDILGNIVFQTTKKQIASGEQQIEVNTAELRTGFYFCILKTESASEAKKLQIIK